MLKCQTLVISLIRISNITIFCHHHSRGSMTALRICQRKYRDQGKHIMSFVKFQFSFYCQSKYIYEEQKKNIQNCNLCTLTSKIYFCFQFTQFFHMLLKDILYRYAICTILFTYIHRMQDKKNPVNSREIHFYLFSRGQKECIPRGIGREAIALMPGQSPFRRTKDRIAVF